MFDMGDITTIVEESHSPSVRMSVTPLLGSTPIELKTSKGKRGRPRGSTNKGNGEADAQRLLEVLNLLRDTTDEIKRNMRTNSVLYSIGGKTSELEGDDLSLLYLELADTLGKSAPKQLVIDAVNYLANQNEFDPVIDWLKECDDYEPLTDEEWDNIGSTIWSTDVPIVNLITQRLLIKAVARAFEPGCTADWITIAVGSQGVGKSRTFELLSPKPEFFGEISQTLNHLEREKGILHGNFINCLEEGDRLISGKGSNTEGFKNLISVKTDQFRKPYAVDPQKRARNFILVMTSNRHDFICDAESRRTLPIRIPSDHEVPELWLKQNLRRIWARAIKEYREGTRYLFTRKEIQENLEYLNGFRAEDPIESVLDEYLLFHKEIQAHQAVEHCLQLPKHLQERKHTRRITDMLKARGWENKTTTRKIDGKLTKLRLWIKPENAQTLTPIETDF